jgi:hypothetical protein
MRSEGVNEKRSVISLHIINPPTHSKKNHAPSNQQHDEISAAGGRRRGGAEQKLAKCMHRQPAVSQRTTEPINNNIDTTS